MGTNLYVQLKKVETKRLFFRQTIQERHPNLLKNIFFFWDKGIDAAPDICKLCLQSWRDMNPGWTIHIFDQESANDIVNINDFPETIRINHYANILRTTLLATRGGVWADATLLCLKPLDEWLPLFFCQSPFFAFYRPGRDRLLSNWFIASERLALLTQKWYEKTNKYWEGREKADTYYCHHYLFESIIVTSSRARNEWKRTPKISAVPQILLKRSLGSTGLDMDTARTISHTPVQKLSHKGSLTPDDIARALQLIEEAAA